MCFAYIYGPFILPPTTTTLVFFYDTAVICCISHVHVWTGCVVVPENPSLGSANWCYVEEHEAAQIKVAAGQHFVRFIEFTFLKELKHYV